MRGIARPETGEISSLSCEECEGQEIVVALFEIQSTAESRKAYVEREHEFRFLAVQCEDLHGKSCPTLAVGSLLAVLLVLARFVLYLTLSLLENWDWQGRCIIIDSKKGLFHCRLLMDRSVVEGKR